MNERMVRFTEVAIFGSHNLPILQHDINEAMSNRSGDGWQLHTSPILTTVHDGDGDFYHTVILTFSKTELEVDEPVE